MCVCVLINDIVVLIVLSTFFVPRGVVWSTEVSVDTGGCWRLLNVCFGRFIRISALAREAS